MSQACWWRGTVGLIVVLGLVSPLRAEETSDRENGAPLEPVSHERLLTGTAEPADWLMYGGSYDNSRFSPLGDINRDNVSSLSLAWVFQTGVPYQFQASPIVADGILYVTAAYNHLYALDAATGDPAVEVRPSPAQGSAHLLRSR